MGYSSDMFMSNLWRWIIVIAMIVGALEALMKDREG